MRVLVPRGGAWGDEVRELLEARGHEAVVVPLIRIEPADDQDAVARAMDAVTAGRFDWIVISSSSTVRYLPRIPVSTNVAAVGNVTAAALRERGIPVAFVPSQQSADGLVDEWPIPSGTALWPHSEDARPTIRDGLAARGMQVTDVVAYRTVPLVESVDEVEAHALADEGAGFHELPQPQAAGQDDAGADRDDDAVLTAVEPAATPIDAVLVTSGSVARLVARLGLPDHTLVVASADQTAEDARRRGLDVAAVATVPTAAALVDALARASAPA